jgi:hypothetical protein
MTPAYPMPYPMVQPTSFQRGYYPAPYGMPMYGPPMPMYGPPMPMPYGRGY